MTEGLEKPGEKNADLQSKIKQIEVVKIFLSVEILTRYNFIILQKLRGDLEKHAGPIDDCLQATDQLTTDGADVLSPDEFQSLKRHRDELSDRFLYTRLRTDTMLDR